MPCATGPTTRLEALIAQLIANTPQLAPIELRSGTLMAIRMDHETENELLVLAERNIEISSEGWESEKRLNNRQKKKALEVNPDKNRKEKKLKKNKEKEKWPGEDIY